MFKKGDIVICKKSEKEEGSLFRYTFEKGKKYRIDDVHYFPDFPGVKTDYLIGFIATTRPEDYFYTKQEERKLKLQKIINSE